MLVIMSSNTTPSRYFLIFFRFNFPQAFSMTMLAWGAIEYKNGFVAAGEWKY